MKNQDLIVKAYTLGDPLGNISEFGQDTYEGTMWVGGKVKDASVATGEAIVNTADVVGDAVYDAGVATGEAVGNAAVATGKAVKNAAVATGDAIKEGAIATGDAISQGYHMTQEKSQQVKKATIKSIADWANGEMEKIEPSPVLTPN